MSNDKRPCRMVPLWKSKRHLYKHLKACYRSSHSIFKERDTKPSIAASIAEFLGLLQACFMIIGHRRVRLCLMLPVTAILLFLFILFQDDPSAYLSNEGTSHKRGLLNGFLPWKPQEEILETFTPFPLLEVDCPAILNGDPYQIAFTKDMLYKENHKWASDVHMIKLFRNCTLLGSSMRHSNSLQEFSVAYIIHLQQNAFQFHSLMEAIYSPHNFYCFTLNSSSSPLFKRAVRTYADCHSNIVIQNITNRLPHLLEYVVLDAEIKCMQRLYQLGSWMYAMNLPEHALPLKPIRTITRNLKSLRGKNLITGTALNSSMWKNHLPIQELTLYQGSQYYIVAREFAQYVSVNKLPYQILQYLNGTHITDKPRELYWATLNNMRHAPGGRESSSLDLLPYAKPQFKENSQCQNDECTVLIDDLVHIKGRANLFALGFNCEIDHVALQCIAEHVKNSSYWTNSTLS